VQADVLDGGPDNRQATVLRREHVDLIGTLTHIAKQAFNRVGGLNVPVQRLRKRIKRQEVRFVFPEASHRLWIALAIFGFEGTQLSQRFLFCCLLPDANQFGLDLAPLSSGNGSQDSVYGLRTS
jgi:hypothetical protein